MENRASNSLYIKSTSFVAAISTPHERVGAWELNVEFTRKER